MPLSKKEQVIIQAVPEKVVEPLKEVPEKVVEPLKEVPAKKSIPQYEEAEIDEPIRVLPAATDKPEVLSRGQLENLTTAELNAIINQSLDLSSRVADWKAANQISRWSTKSLADFILSEPVEAVGQAFIVSVESPDAEIELDDPIFDKEDPFYIEPEYIPEVGDEMDGGVVGVAPTVSEFERVCHQLDNLKMDLTQAQNTLKAAYDVSTAVAWAACSLFLRTPQAEQDKLRKYIHNVLAQGSAAVLDFPKPYPAIPIDTEIAVWWDEYNMAAQGIVKSHEGESKNIINTIFYPATSKTTAMELPLDAALNSYVTFK